MTVTIDHAVSIRVGSIHADYEHSSLDVFMGDDCLSTRGLHKNLDMDIDSEVIPVLVGVGWSGDHTRRAQIHFPAYLETDPVSGAEDMFFNYDRLELIDAAIIALQRTRDVVARTNGDVA